MADGDEARVYKALLNHIEAFNAKPENGFRVSIPNKAFTPTSYPYLDVQDFRAERRGPTLGTLKTIGGIFQVTVIIERNTGLVEAKEIVSRIIAHVPKGLRLYDENTCVHISQQANERAPIYEDTEVRVPVTIPYEAYV